MERAAKDVKAGLDTAMNPSKPATAVQAAGEATAVERPRPAQRLSRRGRRPSSARTGRGEARGGSRRCGQGEDEFDNRFHSGNQFHSGSKCQAASTAAAKPAAPAKPASAAKAQGIGQTQNRHLNPLRPPRTRPPSRPAPPAKPGQKIEPTRRRRGVDKSSAPLMEHPDRAQAAPDVDRSAVLHRLPALLLHGQGTVQHPVQPFLWASDWAGLDSDQVDLIYTAPQEILLHAGSSSACSAACSYAFR